MSENMNVLKKITTSKLIPDLKQIVRNDMTDGEVRHIYSIGGVVNGFSKGYSPQYDSNWVKFLGRFDAVVVSTGEVFSSFACFIIEPMQSAILNKLETAETVEFALEVCVKRDDNADIGYEYVLRPIFTAKEDESVIRLRNVLTASAAGKRIGTCELQVDERAEKFDELDKTEVKKIINAKIVTGKKRSG